MCHLVPVYTEQKPAVLYAGIALRGKREEVAKVLPCLTHAHRIIVCEDNEVLGCTFAIAWFESGLFQNGQESAGLLQVHLCRRALPSERPDAYQMLVPSLANHTLLIVSGKLPLTWVAWAFSTIPHIVKVQIARAKQEWVVGWFSAVSDMDRLLLPDNAIDVEKLPLGGSWKAD